jgi:hypothetical protein
MLWKKFGAKEDEVKGSGEDYVIRCFMICTSYKTLFV